MITRRQALAAGVFAPWALAASSVAGGGGLVRLLIDTPRESLLAALAARIRDGLAPAELLRALAIAACREVSPYPNVGFKYHAVMMLQSVQLSMAALPGELAWLPLLWTADYFKTASAQEDRFRPWSLPAVPERSGGTPELSALVDGLASWDRDEADRATAALLDTGQIHAVLQTLMLHAARDFRAIGHKTITAANAHRLYSALGSPVAAPLTRSLVLAVQNPEGDANPAQHEHVADGDWKANQVLAGDLPRNWRTGRNDAAAAQTLLAELRTATSEQAVSAAMSLLTDDVSAHTVWEAVMMFAAELILRRNNIIAVHANTMANAMRYCYGVSDADSAQRLLLLQAVAFMARFRALVDRDWRVRDRRIDAIELLPAASVDEIFQTLGRSRFRAVRQALGWLDAGGDPATLAARARWYATLKITGTHDIKVTEAMQENYGWLRFPWRNALLAASLMYANASTAPDDDVVARARALIGFGRTTGSS
ncbi:MAG: hypothetical protein E2O58_11905 [Gammaproteobacteria bacterium]|nr:MAG: hypothetical protein E2O58_11905 [Gammaproteobacteria bacterium]